tara:strand:+ start:232 stop:465 length:234 start_codon:yes stop_codon:yes gene_type:complete
MKKFIQYIVSVFSPMHMKEEPLHEDVGLFEPDHIGSDSILLNEAHEKKTHKEDNSNPFSRLSKLVRGTGLDTSCTIS